LFNILAVIEAVRRLLCLLLSQFLETLLDILNYDKFAGQAGCVIKKIASSTPAAHSAADKEFAVVQKGAPRSSVLYRRAARIASASARDFLCVLANLRAV